MKQFFSTVLIVLCCICSNLAQQKENPLETETKFMESLQWRCIGPYRGGRSCAVAGDEKNKQTFYFGSTGGGVWKTTDAGNNWKNISDKYFGGSIGAIAVSKSDGDIIFVGQGEQTVRGNVSEGNGIWKTTDGGRTWQFLGLKDTRHIVRIRIHPKNPDIVYVAALGHLFGSNDERGIYKTLDGGKTWQKILFIDNQTGAADLVTDPLNFETIYATMWNIKRTPYSLESGGPNSSIWKSVDGGNTWRNITNNDGLPSETLGLICVTVSPANPDRVWAMIEAKNGGLFRSDDAGETWTTVNQDRKLRQRAWYFSRIYAEPKDANKIIALNVQMFRSTDGGKSFNNQVNTPHGDHHDLWIDPDDAKRMIVGDDGGAQISNDGGITWSTYQNQPTAQFYRVTTDNHFPYRIYGAQQDNSSVRILHRSSKGSIGRDDWQPTAGSESGHIVADPLNDDIVYGGSYGGYLTRYNHKTGENRNITIWPDNPMGWGADSLKYRFQWNFPIFFSPNNPKKLYAAANVLFSTIDEGHSWQVISPDLTRNDKSKQKSSGGIITQDNTSVEYYSTIFAACESPYEKDLLWCGTDDGLIQISRNGGGDWKNVTPKDLPEWSMVNKIEPDPFHKGGCYIAATKYKSDDFQPLIFKTEDYGVTWKKITSGIATDHFTRAVCCDTKIQGLLYAGTENGMYISTNDGKLWKPFNQNLPQVPITDLTIKDDDLIVATQGRSFWILDDLTRIHYFLQNKEQTNKEFFLIKPRDTWRLNSYVITSSTEGENPLPGVVVNFYIDKKNQKKPAELSFYDSEMKLIRSFKSDTKAENEKLTIKNGMNHFSWNMQYPDAEKFDGMILWSGGTNGPYAPPGNYTVVLKFGNDSAAQNFRIKHLPNLESTELDIKQQFDFLIKCRNKLSEVHKAISDIRGVKKILNNLTVQNDSLLSKECKDSIQIALKELISIEEELYQTKSSSSQDPINFPIKLNDKLAGLMSVAEESESKPSVQSLELYNVLDKSIQNQLTRLSKVFEQTIPEINKMVRNLNIPYIQTKW